MKKVVKPRHALAFQIWFEKLGYSVKQTGKGFVATTADRFIKKRHHHVLVTDALGGNQAAYELGQEFEDHLISIDLKVA
ncbi:response regulator (plasmid) [Acinetobacter thermotolerans]|uniref:response regulator n=1 Tax=Acinetobacter thermotolerans TaxID=3151487 RepID=UPI00325B068B